MIICLCTNLKQKFSKLTELKINKFIENTLCENNYSSIFKEILSHSPTVILIEDRSLSKIENIREVLSFFEEHNIKIIILYARASAATLYINLNFFNIVNISQPGFIQKIINLYTNSGNVETVLEEPASDYFFESSTPDITNELPPFNTEKTKTVKSKIFNKQTKIESVQQKYSPNQLNFLGINLDHKIYATTFLLNLAYYYSRTKEVVYTEINPQSIDYSNLINFRELTINYAIQESYINIEENLKLNKIKKKELVSIIDMGFLTTQSPEFDMSLYTNIFVFTTNCPKVNKNQSYLDSLNFFSTQKNVIIISREKLFMKFFQSDLNIILSDFKNKKFISKFFDIWFFIFNYLIFHA